MKKLLGLVFCVLIASMTGSAFAAGGPYSYVVLSKGNGFGAGARADIEAAGGVVSAYLPQIGVAIVTADAAFAEAEVKGAQSITRDVELSFVDPLDFEPVSFEEAAAVNPPFTGDDDFFFDLQWGHTAIRAADAWATGARGAGVRVAVLDTGIDSDHPDLAPNLNTVLSTSFVPGEAYDALPPGFSHGTHVAGIVAAADNGYGVIGVAPEAELVAIKVISAFTGRGSFGQIIQGIVYAADVDADVINMSLGVFGGLAHDAFPGVASLFVATGRATTYAYQQGSTVIVAAGNEASDLDHNGNVKAFPAELPHVIAISATGPEGWAFDPATDTDRLASYSSYGQSAIHFAAPGGDYSYYFVDRNAVCTVILTQRCYYFDSVFSTINGGWTWSSGTSMAAPYASGVAALVIGKNGGAMHPAQVEAALRASADDLGKPGQDDVYGHGRINAARAVH